MIKLAGNIEKLQNKFFELRNNKDRLTLWMNNLIVIYAFFIPIDASITSRIFVVILALLFLRGNIVEPIKTAWKNGVIRAFAYMFVIYLLWLVGSDNFKEGLHSLKSFKSALYIFVFYILIDGRYRDKILVAFIFGIVVSAILSYLMFFHIIPWNYVLAGEYIYKAPAIEDPSPFLHHLHYGVLLSFAAVLLAQRVLYSHKNIRFKIILALLTISVSVNVFIIGGRTGYFTFFPIVALFVFYYHRRWIFPVMLGILLCVGTIYESSPILQNKVNQTIVEVKKLTQIDADFDSSLGQRAGFWMYSTQVIKNNFWLGVGTGDSMSEVRAIIPPKDASIKLIAHEHNQYISVMLQFGIIGLVFFLNIFYQIYKFKPDDQDIRFVQLAITLAIGIGITMTMFNLRVFLHLWVLILAVSMVPKSRQSVYGPLQSSNHFIIQTLSFGVFFYLAIFLKEAVF